MYGTMKRGRPRTRLKDEFEEDLSIMGIRKGEAGDGQRPSGMEEDSIGSQGSKTDCSACGEGRKKE
jgi:hypothetical protein